MTRKIIKLSFDFSVWLIEKFSDTKPYVLKVEALRELPKGTLGNDIAKCLDENNLRLVPHYESHDLKHILLDFKMTPVDEIRMQAFMLGNGNHSFPCFAILIFGVILLPTKWKIFLQDYKNGSEYKPISTWKINDYSHLETDILRTEISQPILKPDSMITIESIGKFGAYGSIVAGICGMLFCLPFLFSSSIADILSAGFPFIASAILSVGGLVALSNLSRPKQLKTISE